MTATIKLLSMLISLAMMLTGTYGVEAPEPAARTLTVSNVTLTVGDESVTLTPSLSMGVATEAGKALYDAAVNLDDKALFPVQLSVTEEALTALAKGADVSVTVPASVIDGLVELAGSQVTVTGDPESAELVKFLTNEFIPAYAKALKKVADPEAQKENTAKADALMDQVADRGEGEPDVVEIEGQAYDVTTYEYTLNAEQLAELVDLVYTTVDEDLNALYEAIFKLYDMMPEESGLKGLHSFADVFEATGMEMSANIIDRRTDDDSVRVSDTQFIIDMASTIANAQAATTADDAQADETEDAEDGAAVGVLSGEDEGSGVVATGDANSVPPMVIDVHSTKVGDSTSARATCEYSVENVAMSVESNATREADVMSMDVKMSIDMGEEGEMEYNVSGARTSTSQSFDADIRFANGNGQDVNLTCAFAGGAEADTADWPYSLTAEASVNGDAAGSGTFTMEGVQRGDGTAHADIAMNGDFAGTALGMSLAADVSADPIEDAATGHEGMVIDSVENIPNLMQDEATMGKLMQAVGSFTADAGTLMQDESVTALMGLFEKAVSGALTSKTADNGDELAAEGLEPIDGAEEVEDVEEELDEIEPDIEYGDTVEGDDDEAAAEPEDDGELAYGMPAFTFLPEGMAVREDETYVNTAYDSVTMNITDETYQRIILATFSPAEGTPSNYTIGADGTLQAADGLLQISRSDPGSWMVTANRDSVVISLYIDDATMDEATIARIISGITF